MPRHRLVEWDANMYAASTVSFSVQIADHFDACQL